MSRSALVVTDDIAQLARWTDWLDRAGFTVAACRGPSVRARCPRMQDKPCLLRETVQVAVVGTRSIEGGLGANRPEQRCTRLPDDATTIFIDECGVWATVEGTLRQIGRATDWTLASVATYLCSRQTPGSDGT